MKAIRIFLLLAWVVAVVGCSWKSDNRPSIFLVVVDSFPASSLSCGDNVRTNRKSGFQVFCQESVRFTHAYTPSILSQPALTSILTARYPHEHGVWHNGSQALSGKMETVAEMAVKTHYRTAFFSGGPPIWRKSGLSQGFEVFEDNIDLKLNHYYRPAIDSFKLLLSWLDRDVGKQPVFVVVTVPDLQFIHRPTVTDMGIVREKSYESQQEEFDESLTFFYQELRRRNLWHSSHIILAGLNGYTKRLRPQEHKGSNLYAENSQVALFIKPASKKRDLGLQWKMDRNVSLVDLGATLFDLLESPIPAPVERKMEVISLKPVFSSMEAHWDESRTILIESAWAHWQKVGSSRFGARKGHLLFLYDRKTRTYNTLTDRMEMNPLSENDPLIKDALKEIETYFEEKGFVRWRPLPDSYVDKIQLASEIWGSNVDDQSVYEDLRLLSRKMPWDHQILQWWAMIALKRQNWKELKDLGEMTFVPLWTFVAKVNMGSHPTWPRDKCLRLLRHGYKKFIRPSAKVCADDLFIDLLSWIKQTDSVLEAKYREDFLRAYVLQLIDRDVAALNYSIGLLWDVLPKNLDGPSLTDLVLALPHYKQYKKAVQRRIRHN